MDTAFGIIKRNVTILLPLRSRELRTMHQLPPEVEEEFCLGNFVVKGSDQSFNKVDPDHSLEWLNGIGKRVVESLE